MVQWHEIILKAGPAPRPVPTASPSPKAPPTTPSKGTARKTTSSASRRSTTRKRKAAAEADGSNSDGDEFGLGLPHKIRKKATFIQIVGIDLGMWGFGRGRASNEKDPASVVADLNWPDSQLIHFKNPSIVAFKRDNPGHRAFRDVKDALLGFNVSADMVRCSFFKASLDRRAQTGRFDNPILQEEIAKSLVSFSTPQKDEEAAMTVLKYLYETEIEKISQSFTGFDDHPLEDTKFIFVLTHPAACSKEGRDNLERIAKAAGLGSRQGDELKLLSEAQAAAMASFISYQHVERSEVWKTYFAPDEWITVLDIGSLTVDTTTEEVVRNDPRLQLNQKIVSDGGRCGTVTLHLQLLNKILDKFAVAASDLPPELVGRGSRFHGESEGLLRKYTGDESGSAPTLTLRLPSAVQHPDYDASFGEVTLQIEEIREVFDEYLVFLKKILKAQFNGAIRRRNRVKTTVICGGGSLIPYVWLGMRQFCEEQNVKAVRPDDAIAAVCRGAIISELSDGLLGQRLLRAHFGIKIEVNGTVQMQWILRRGDIVDTTAPKMLQKVAGHFTLSVDKLLNRAAKFQLKIYTYDKDDREVTDPEDPGVEEITSITVDKSNLSTYLQNKLTAGLRSLDFDNNNAQNKTHLDIEVLLSVDEYGQLYFQVKAGASSLGQGKLRYDSTRNFL